MNEADSPIQEIGPVFYLCPEQTPGVGESTITPTR